MPKPRKLKRALACVEAPVAELLPAEPQSLLPVESPELAELRQQLAEANARWARALPVLQSILAPAALRTIINGEEDSWAMEPSHTQFAEPIPIHARSVEPIPIVQAEPVEPLD